MMLDLHSPQPLLLGRVQPAEMAAVYQRARQMGQLAPEDDSVVFYDFSRLQARLDELNVCFPAGTIHAVAMKTNPLRKVLEAIRDAGFGFEVSSLTEMQMAKHLGVVPAAIVFDSPVKTVEELRYAMAHGIHINIDNFDELQRVIALRQEVETASRFGLRINPQVGQGTIASTSVADTYSKFGIPLTEYYTELVDILTTHTWLEGVHVHVGSQGMSLDLLVEGVQRVYDFALAVNARRSPTQQIAFFDIGGGLSVPYRAEDQPPTLAAYAEALQTACPRLFTDFTLITEFGRYIHANCAWVASRVEYIKDTTVPTLLTHVGADMFIRKVYNPADWHHDMWAADPQGRLKPDTFSQPYMVAGPLCFGGDFIGHHVPLPPVAVHDLLFIADVGAYTLGMWSRYNSRPMPKVLGYYDQGEGFQPIKARETFTDLLDFWA